MLRIAAVLAGAALLPVRPLAAQSGLASAHRSVTLTATRLASVSVAPAGGASTGLDRIARIPVRTSWNADPAQPFGISLAAYFDLPVVDGRGRPAGADEAGNGRVVLPARPAPALSARGDRSDDLQVRIDLLGRFDSSQGTLTLVAITQ